MGLGAELGFLQDPDRFIGLLKIAYQRRFGRDGAMELDKHLLADRQFGIERFLVSTGVVKPDQGRGQIEEREPFFAADLNGRRWAKCDGFGPDRGDISPAADLG